METKLQFNCCPSNSWPSISSDYIPQGEIKTIGDNLPIYSIGNSENVVLIAYDIFGLQQQGSRVRQVSDEISQKTGFQVVIIDFYRGIGYDQSLGDFGKIIEFVSQYPKSKLLQDYQTTREYLKEKGAKKFGIIGICWGTLTQWYEQGQNDYCCGINWHPSVQLETFVFKGSQEDLAQNLKCAQLILTAGNDQANMKKDGDLVKILQEKSFGKDVETYDFPEMQHGWVVRGDLTKEEVKRDIQKAIQITVQYLNRIFNQ